MSPLDDNFFQLIIDEDIEMPLEEKEQVSEVRELMELACSEAFTIAQRNKFLTDLRNDSNIIHMLGLSPDKLPSLVENNPVIALEVLLKLMETPESSDFLSVLVNMEVSVQSMDFVNR